MSTVGATARAGGTLPMSLDRAAWLRSLREVSPEQEDALAPIYDANWGRIDEVHRAFVDDLLERLPPAGRVLDAACGTGQYLGMVLTTGRSVVGVDQSGAYLEIAQAKARGAETARADLQELPFEHEFDGVMCVDAMEFIPPEDWPVVLGGFRRALGDTGWLYLTVELVRDDAIRAATSEARAAGLPVVDGEAIWPEYGGYYHFYPSLDRVRGWLADAGFRVERELEGPWEEDEYAYHHILAGTTAAGALHPSAGRRTDRSVDPDVTGASR